MSGVTLNTVSLLPKTNNIQPKDIDTKPIENVENKIDGEKIIGLSLGGLATLGLAALAIKKGKGKDIIDDSKAVMDKGKEAITDLLKTVKGQANRKIMKAIKRGDAETAKTLIQKHNNRYNAFLERKAAEEIGQTASKAIGEGANYLETKKIALRNLSHESKDIVKKSLTGAHDAKLAQENLVRKTTTEAMEAVTKSANAAKATTSGIKKANSEKLLSIADNAADAAIQAQEEASKVAKIAQNAPTHKNIKRAKVAENKAIAAKNNAQKTFEKAIKRADEITENATKKAENIAKQQASPNYEAGLKKQAENAAKQNKAKEARVLKKAKARPNWKNAEKKLSRYSKEQLEAVISNPKSSNIDVRVAKYLLG